MTTTETDNIDVMQHARAFVTEGMSDLARSRIISALIQIPAIDRADIVQRALPLIPLITSGSTRASTILALYEFDSKSICNDS